MATRKKSTATARKKGYTASRRKAILTSRMGRYLKKTNETAEALTRFQGSTLTAKQKDFLRSYASIGNKFFKWVHVHLPDCIDPPNCPCGGWVPPEWLKVNSKLTEVLVNTLVTTPALAQACNLEVKFDGKNYAIRSTGKMATNTLKKK